MFLNLLLLLLVSGQAITDEVVKNATQTAEVEEGGDKKEILYPFVVSIHIFEEYSQKMTHQCSGSIIDKHWVLTAAHCLILSASTTNKTMLVHYGLTRKLDYGESFVEVEEIFIHENSTRAPGPALLLQDPFIRAQVNLNNIGLVKLKKPIEGMEILNLPDRDLNITENTSVRVFAYARPHMAKYGLKWMNLKTISDKDCEEYHFGSPSQMCAGDIYTNGVCSNDAGGPVILVKQKVQVGIYLGGQVTCGFIDEIYTKVSAYIDWIEEKTGLTFATVMV